MGAEKTIRGDKNNISNNTQSKNTIRGEAIKQSAKITADIQNDKTLRGAGISKTLRGDNKSIEKSPQVTSYTQYVLNGQKYNVVKTLSDCTGEAQIILVEKEGEQMVLKLYFPNYTLPDKQVMDAICKLAATGLLVKTYAYGTWEDSTTHIKRDFELMEYCSGGSLDQVKIGNNEELLGQITLRCATALNFLHKNNIIHRDIKPANFFFRNPGQNPEDIVLADFGIAILANEEGKVQIDYQARTVIYTAPEYYFSVDNKIEISFKSDFYSLGMLLMTMLNGEELFRINEYKLIELKRTGTLPYPANLSDHTLQLLKALTDMNPSTRASLAEIARWIKGENIYDLKRGQKNEEFEVIFNQSKQQVAHSPAELANYIYTERELGTKYLYSGKIAEWLTENKLPELAIEIEDIVENQYPKNKNAGLFAACYFLDSSIPYYNVENVAITSAQEIAVTLVKHADFYEKALADKENELFLFFNSHGARKLTKKFVPLFKKNGKNTDALYQLVYTLDSSLPWIITNEENESFSCATIADVLNFTREETYSDQSWDALTGEAFVQWVGIHDPMVEGKIRAENGSKENSWCVLYNLDPMVSFNFILDKSSNLYYFTAQEVGEYINNCLSTYLENPDDSDYESSILDMVCDIDDTRLYYYFKSKGVYDDKIEWIKYCMDVNSKENSQKYGPYNWRIGVYKVIEGLGFSAYYHFKKSDVNVFNLEGLKNIPKKEIISELQDGYLDDWLAINFQENPDLDLSTQYSYEEQTVEYLKEIERYDPKQEEVLRFNHAKNQVANASKKLKRALSFQWGSIALLSVLTLVATGLMIYLTVERDFGFSISHVGGWIIWVLIGLGVVIYNVIRDRSDSSIFMSLLKTVGIMVGVMAFLILFIKHSFYAVLLICSLWLIRILWVCLKIHRPATKGLAPDLYSLTFEMTDLEPLHYAYRTKDNTFQSSVIGNMDYQASNSNRQSKLWYKMMLPYIVAVFGLSYIMANIDSIYVPKAETENSISLTLGIYKGNFGVNKAEMEITRVDGDQVEGVMSVRFRKLQKEEFSGTIDMKNNTFIFYDKATNGILDGKYEGTFKNDFNEIEGIYENYTSKKKVNIELAR